MVLEKVMQIKADELQAVLEQIVLNLGDNGEPISYRKLAERTGVAHSLWHTWISSERVGKGALDVTEKRMESLGIKFTLHLELPDDLIN